MTDVLPLTVNGDAAEARAGWSVRDLLADRLGREITAEGRAADGSALGVAVAVDDAVVPRSRWASTPLAAGARCEIVTAVQGG